MSEKMDISIVIVTWNSERDISDCLASIDKAANDLNVEVFVVDNASGDNTVSIVEKYYPEVIVIKNSDNLGFAKANNLALKASTGNFVLLLNPDTVLNEMSLVDSVAYMNNHDRAGVLGCAIRNPNHTQQFSVRKFPSILSQVLILCKLHNFFPRLKPISKYFALEFDYSKEQSVDQVMGAFMFIKRNCMDMIGLLDERFWIWFEDVDYCKRAVLAGWDVKYVPNISIIHKQSSSFAKLLALEEQKLFNRSMLSYMKKYHGKATFWFLQLFTPLSIALSFVVGLFENKTNKLSIK